jgi:hypothetical protein
MEDLRFENIGDTTPQGKNSGRCSKMTEGIEDVKPVDDDKGYDDNPINEEHDFNESEDDLMSSQDLEKFAKDDDLVLPSPKKKTTRYSLYHKLKGLPRMLGKKL